MSVTYDANELSSNSVNKYKKYQRNKRIHPPEYYWTLEGPINKLRFSKNQSALITELKQSNKIVFYELILIEQ